MADNELVVSDTSPLLNLALIDRLDLVREGFSTVTVPNRVWDELLDEFDTKALVLYDPDGEPVLRRRC